MSTIFKSNAPTRATSAITSWVLDAELRAEKLLGLSYMSGMPQPMMEISNEERSTGSRNRYPPDAAATIATRPTRRPRCKRKSEE